MKIKFRVNFNPKTRHRRGKREGFHLGLLSIPTDSDSDQLILTPTDSDSVSNSNSDSLSNSYSDSVFNTRFRLKQTLTPTLTPFPTLISTFTLTPTPTPIRTSIDSDSDSDSEPRHCHSECGRLTHTVTPRFALPALRHIFFPEAQKCSLKKWALQRDGKKII